MTKNTDIIINIFVYFFFFSNVHTLLTQRYKFKLGETYHWSTGDVRTDGRSKETSIPNIAEQGSVACWVTTSVFAFKTPCS